MGVGKKFANVSSPRGQILVFYVFSIRGERTGFLWLLSQKGASWLRWLSDQEKLEKNTYRILARKKEAAKMNLASLPLVLLAAVSLTSGVPTHHHHHKPWSSNQPQKSCKWVSEVKYRTEYKNECTQGPYKWVLLIFCLQKHIFLTT